MVERFKGTYSSNDLVSVGLARIRAKVNNCNLNVLDDIASVSREMVYGRLDDKTINEQVFKESREKLDNLINLFQKRCSCIIK